MRKNKEDNAVELWTLFSGRDNCLKLQLVHFPLPCLSGARHNPFSEPDMIAILLLGFGGYQGAKLVLALWHCWDSATQRDTRQQQQ